MKRIDARAAVWLWIALAAAWVAVSALRDPAYNWDIIGYVASAEKLLGVPEADLRRSTYDDIRRTVPAARYAEMTSGGTGYRWTVSDDDTAFLQQLPFYRIRAGYIALIAAVSTFTPTIAAATVAVSALAAAATLLLAGALLRRSRALLLVLTPPVLLLAGIGDVAALSTPDALAGLAALALMGLSLTRPLAAAAFSPALVLIRTDFIILSALICLEAALRDRRAASLIGVPVAAALTGWINERMGNYGFVTIFNFTLISGPVPYPATIPLSRDPADYIAAYIIGLERIRLWAGLGLTWLAGHLIAHRLDPHRPKLRQDTGLRLSLVGLAFMTGHFLLFPAGFARFYGFVFIFLWIAFARRFPARPGPGLPASEATPAMSSLGAGGGT